MKAIIDFFQLSNFMSCLKHLPKKDETTLNSIIQIPISAVFLPISIRKLIQTNDYLHYQKTALCLGLRLILLKTLALGMTNSADNMQIVQVYLQMQKPP